VRTMGRGWKLVSLESVELEGAGPETPWALMKLCLLRQVCSVFRKENVTNRNYIILALFIDNSIEDSKKAVNKTKKVASHCGLVFFKVLYIFTALNFF
jgi:hypothetical protein